MFHFWFAKKIEVAMRSMKYTAMHLSKFKRQNWAFLSSTLQLVIILLIEIVNILNLCQISTCMEILINYIALGFVSEFSTHFLEPFKNSEMASLIGAVLPYENFRNTKVIIKQTLIDKIYADIDSEKKSCELPAQVAANNQGGVKAHSFSFPKRVEPFPRALEQVVGNQTPQQECMPTQENLETE